MHECDVYGRGKLPCLLPVCCQYLEACQGGDLDSHKGYDKPVLGSRRDNISLT